MNNTSKIFKKHFGGNCAAGIFHPNFESFFTELNEDCKKEDEEKAKNDRLINKNYKQNKPQKQ